MKNRTILSDQWVDRNYIMDHYPLSNRSYNLKVDLLDSELYSGYTFIGRYKKRFIDKSILDTIFLSDRIPNYNQPHQIRKWVQRHHWKYFGNITPLDSDLRSNLELIKKLFKILKTKHRDLILFFSIEKNPNSNNLYHTHFLIKTSYILNLKEIITLIKQDLLLSEFLFPKEIKTNSRIQIDEYDYDLFERRGLNYVLKFDHKIGLLK
jgi:hypothetical protein